MEDLNVVNDTQETVVESQTEGAESGKEQKAAETATEKKVQTPEENAAFREMRLELDRIKAEKEQTQRDATYSRKYPDLGFTTEAELKALYGNDGISSYEELDAYYENLSKAEQMNTSPELLKEMQNLKSQVEALAKEKQDLINIKEVEKVSKEMQEQYGEIFTSNEKEITELAEKMGMMNGQGIKAATAAIVAEKFPTIYKDLNDKLAKAKEEGVKEYFEKKKTEVPVEGAGTPPSSVGNSNKSSWDTARESSLAALRGK